MNENENQSANPYAAPTVAVITAKRDDADLAFISAGQTVPAGNGASWAGQAWTLFKKNPGIFIVSFIIQIVLGLIFNLIPIIGMFIGILVGPIFSAGWIVMANNAHNDEPVELGQFFSGLQNKAGELFTLGAIYLGFSFLFFIVLGVFGIVVFGTALLGILGGSGAGLENLGAVFAGGGMLLILVFVLITMVGSFLLYASIWFAPALIVLHNVTPWDAVKKSFSAFLKNWLAFVVLFLVFFGLVIGSAFTLFLGLLVVIPMLLLTSYSSYRDVFTDGQ